MKSKKEVIYGGWHFCDYCNLTHSNKINFSICPTLGIGIWKNNKENKKMFTFRFQENGLFIRLFIINEGIQVQLLKGKSELERDLDFEPIVFSLMDKKYSEKTAKKIAMKELLYVLNLKGLEISQTVKIVSQRI